jgi:7,8-dihydropterin-6-yl-methyl-4-(beta-D-ribofuranosyl)aminobenzene 5'-phosphate synthase
MNAKHVVVIVLLGWLAPTLVMAGQEREITFTVLYDNKAFDDRLQGDWGFACLITGKEKSILFDTGTKPDIFWSNYEKLDLDPRIPDVVVLSHDHGDHTGSLWSFLEKNHRVSVYAHGSFQRGFFEKVKAEGAELVRVDAPLEICEGVHLTGPLGTAIVEQSLVVETDEGLVIVVGCSHPGVVEIVKKAKAMLKQGVLLVFGGFHLLRDSREEIQKVIRELRDLGVKRVGATHCTGEEAIQMFREAYRNEFVEMGVGRVIRIRQTMREMRGPYLGQEPPGATPKAFAPGVISTSNLEHSAPAFSPDGREVYWSLWKRPSRSRR